MTAPAEPGPVRWRYHFVDFVTGNPLAVLPMHGVELGDVLSGAATGKGDVPMQSPAVRSQDLYGATQQRRTLCFAERQVIDDLNGAVASRAWPWAGVVMRRKRSIIGRSLALSMVTLPSYFQRRLVAADREWVEVEALAAQRDLFAEAAACAPGGLVPPVFGRLLDDPAPPSPLTTTRTILASDLTPALEAASKVADETGFDWRFTPYYDSEAGVHRVHLEQGYPRLGRITPADLVWSVTDTRTRSGAVLGGDIEEDGSDVANRYVAVGAGSGPTQLRAIADSIGTARDEMAAGYPLYEDALTSSTQDLRTSAAVAAHARAALAAGFAAEVSVSGITVRGDIEPTLTSYTVGDDATVSLLDPLTERQLIVVGQIVGRTINPAEQGGTETVTMELQGSTAAAA